MSFFRLALPACSWLMELLAECVLEVCVSFQFDLDSSSKTALYGSLAEALRALVLAEQDWLANLANASALLFHGLPHLNWAGFYLLKDNVLVLGPFQGKLACTRIRMGKGVCGTVAQNRTTMVVPDVNAFDGHIACDSDSRSELVVPLVVNGDLFGVLDLDSPILKRFDAEDAKHVEILVGILAGALAAANVNCRYTEK